MQTNCRAGWMVCAWHGAARVRRDVLVRVLTIGVVWLCAALTGWPNAANAASTGGLANLPAVMPAMSCPSVAALDLSGVTDGTVTITSAVLLPAGHGRRKQYAARARLRRERHDRPGCVAV